MLPLARVCCILKLMLKKKNRLYIVTVILLIILVVGLFTGVKKYLLLRWQNLSAVVASRLVDLANTERVSLNLPPLATSSLLSLAAQKKAEDMAANGYFAHEAPDGKSPWFWLDDNGYKYSAAGENLAINFEQSEMLNQAWMKSTLHRDNILRAEFKEIGVGIARGRYEGGPAVFVVQFFGTPVLQ